MMKPGGRATADARNVMPTSNANFLWGCMVTPDHIPDTFLACKPCPLRLSELIVILLF